MSHDQLTAVDQLEAAVIETDPDRILCKKSTSDGSEMSAAYPNLMVFSPVGNSTDGNDSEAPAEHINGHSNGHTNGHTNGHSNGAHEDNVGSNGCHGSCSHDDVSHGNGANDDAEVSFKPVHGSDALSGDKEGPCKDDVDRKPEGKPAGCEKDGPAENNDGSLKAQTTPNLEQASNPEADVEVGSEKPKNAEEESMAVAEPEQIEEKSVNDSKPENETKNETTCTAI